MHTHKHQETHHDLKRHLTTHSRQEPRSASRRPHPSRRPFSFPATFSPPTSQSTPEAYFTTGKTRCYQVFQGTRHWGQKRRRKIWGLFLMDRPTRWKQKHKTSQGLPSSAVARTLPANEGDTGSIPGLGRLHVRQSSHARAPQLLEPLWAGSIRSVASRKAGLRTHVCWFSLSSRLQHAATLPETRHHWRSQGLCKFCFNLQTGSVVRRHAFCRQMAGLRNF